MKLATLLTPTLFRSLRMLGWLALFLALWSPIAYQMSRGVGDGHSAPRSDVNQSRTIVEALRERDSLPPGALTNVQTMAAELAKTRWLNEPVLWLSRSDPALNRNVPPPAAIVLPKDGGPDARPNPEFQALPLAVAVLLRPRFFDLPPHTPVVWTRGLQPDGTWRADNPYGGRGGSIAFADGSVETFKPALSRWNTPLLKFGTEEKTLNIVEALPPGARWSESALSPESAQRVRLAAEADRLREEAYRPIRLHETLIRWAWASLPLLLMVGCSYTLTQPTYTLLGRKIALYVGVAMALWFFHEKACRE